ncbi:hypothetical protein RF11_08527 [Thelohanellus kitauei]|uniref:Uncharacterized protein n=1 Tax=Thelohanellus kitauei TaxID=669202 RepID=A0A0C2JKY0_THEKT|nr:hypothetical protein RF11_08527 [Thelohanellus kitauei]
MLSESRSNKTLSLSERIDVLNRWIEVKLIRQSHSTMAFIATKFHTYLKTKKTFFRIGITIKTQTENVDEHGRQKMLKKRFYVGFPMPGIISCESVVSANGEKLNNEKQDADYFGAESWSRDAPPPVIKDYEAKDIFNADKRLYSRAITEETLSFKKSETATCKIAKEPATLLFTLSIDKSEKLKPLTI